MNLLILYALMHVGIPYHYGGDDPINGYDCSGFVQEMLASGGVSFNPERDRTSQELYNYSYRHFVRSQRRPGAIAFYGKGRRSITHVAFFIDNYSVIEAAGGNRNTSNSSIAARQNAYIRIRPFNYRNDLVGIFFPKYGFLSQGDKIIKRDNGEYLGTIPFSNQKWRSFGASSVLPSLIPALPER